MGASESTSRPNGTEEEEEQQQNNRSSFAGAVTAIATVAAGAAAVAVGSRMLANDADTNEERNRGVTEPSLVNSPRIANNQLINQRSRIWSPPPRGHVKMNTDGSCRPAPTGPSGYGGILRDHQGNWVRGFIGYIGVSDCLTSEFHGILKGLELLDQLELQQPIILETDCQAAYEWVTRQSDNPGRSETVRACWYIIRQCRKLIDKNDVDVKLIHGDANRCADKLANMGIQNEAAYVEIYSIDDVRVPRELRNLVKNDAMLQNTTQYEYY